MGKPYDNCGLIFTNDRKEQENKPDCTSSEKNNRYKMRLAGQKKIVKTDAFNFFCYFLFLSFKTKNLQKLRQFRNG